MSWEVPFLAAFLPCTFEGIEMSMFAYMARSSDKKMGNLGTLLGVLSVFIISYLVYVLLPILITDTAEYLMKIILGLFFLGLASYFLFSDYPTPKSAFITGLIGVFGEGIEVNLFEISAYFMTGNIFPAFIGGSIGFLWILLLSYVVYPRVPHEIMRKIAIGILYTVGFVILTSGLV
jgi:hypothetical protein